MEDMRVRNVLTRMRLKFERMIPVYDPAILHRNDIRPVEGKRSSKQGGYHTFAFKVYLPGNQFFYIDFWGAWADERVPFRNPNWYQKYLKQRKIEFCAANGYPFLILQRRYKELEIERYMRLYVAGLRKGILFSEPIPPKRYRVIKGTSFAMWRKDHRE